MVHTATCRHCGAGFTARRSDAAWCSDRCRKQAARAAVRPAQGTGIHGSLVAAVRTELEATGRTDTALGQLAILLAERLVDPACTDPPAGLSRELRTVMTAAIGPAVRPGRAGDADPCDQVGAARRARERKQRQARDVEGSR